MRFKIIININAFLCWKKKYISHNTYFIENILEQEWYNKYEKTRFWMTTIEYPPPPENTSTCHLFLATYTLEGAPGWVSRVLVPNVPDSLTEVRSQIWS